MSTDDGFDLGKSLQAHHPCIDLFSFFEIACFVCLTNILYCTFLEKGELSPQHDIQFDNHHWYLKILFCVLQLGRYLNIQGGRPCQFEGEVNKGKWRRKRVNQKPKENLISFRNLQSLPNNAFFVHIGIQSVSIGDACSCSHLIKSNQISWSTYGITIHIFIGSIGDFHFGLVFHDKPTELSLKAL